MKKNIFYIPLSVFYVFFMSQVASAQDNQKKIPRVFLDCKYCDQAYVKRNIKFVNYVRDYGEADVHVLVTGQPTGGGGREYTMRFIGLKGYEAINYKLNYFSLQTDTEIEAKDKLIKTLKSGLLPYVSQSPVAYQIKVDYDDTAIHSESEEKDPWNNWIFDIGGNVSFNIESNQREYSIQGEINADRITEDWRIRTALSNEFKKSLFKQDEDKIVSVRRSGRFEGSVVRSVSGHLSTGVFGNIFSSTYRNTRLGSRLNAAVEYNFFPYAISTTKEFTVAYLAGPRYFDYLETTIYDKTRQQLFSESFRINFDMRQTWGSVNVNLEGFHYFHDFSKNRVQLESYLSLRVVKGFFIRLRGEAQIINDQLYLPKGEATLEEVLLQQKALATNFDYELRLGVAYTFGSIYNNIVNTRL